MGVGPLRSALMAFAPQAFLAEFRGWRRSEDEFGFREARLTKGRRRLTLV